MLTPHSTNVALCSLSWGDAIFAQGEEDATVRDENFTGTERRWTSPID
jgi:hypothetical protein